MNKLLAIISIFLFFAANGQQNDTVVLKGIEVEASKLTDFTPKSSTSNLDTLTLQTHKGGTLGEVMGRLSGINIKSYGFGGISNFTIGGAYGNQSPVIWNGFNLQDPLNGAVNMVLFPVYFIDKVQVNLGGESALFGSGAMNGSMHISNSIEFDKGLIYNIFGSLGSFSNQGAGGGISYSNKNFFTRAKIIYLQGINDFEYVNTQKLGNPTEKQRNANFSLSGFTQDNALVIKKNHIIKTNLWYSSSRHHLPFNMTVSSNESRYNDDENLRLALSYTYFDRNFTLNLKNGIFYSNLIYNDLSIPQIYKHASISNITEADVKVNIGRKNLINFGLNSNQTHGISSNLVENPELKKFSVFVSHKISLSKKFDLISNFREEIYLGNLVPLTYSFKTIFSPDKSIQAFISTSKTYRTPTMNDLFWVESGSRGNPNLKPETGYDLNLGTSFLKQWKKWKMELKAKANIGKMDNLISWIPVAGYYSPVNLSNIANFGFDANTSFAYNYNTKLQFSLSSGYSYIRSAMLDGEKNISHAPQLIFIPKHGFNNCLRILMRKSFVEIFQNFVGKRFYTMDNSFNLAAYNKVDLAIGTNFDFLKKHVSASLRIKNITGQVYELMPYYPMPGVNLSFDMNIKFD